jgi:hypothetical protein
LEFFVAGPAKEKLTFVRDSGYLGTMWIEWLDLPPRTATGIALGILALCGLALLLRDWRGRMSLLDAAGICAMLGFVLFYHRQYDNQMLLPLVLASVLRALRSHGVWTIGLALLLGASVYLPAGLVAQYQALSLLAFLTPVTTAVFLLVTPVGVLRKNETGFSPSHSR